MSDMTKANTHTPPEREGGVGLLGWACYQCVKDGLTQQPDGIVSHGLCGPHFDLALQELARWKAARRVA